MNNTDLNIKDPNEFMRLVARDLAALLAGVVVQLNDQNDGISQASMARIEKTLLQYSCAEQAVANAAATRNVRMHKLIAELETKALDALLQTRKPDAMQAITARVGRLWISETFQDAIKDIRRAFPELQGPAAPAVALNRAHFH